MFIRIVLLFSLAWIIRLTAPLFSVLGSEISGRDLILLARRALPDREEHARDPREARRRARATSRRASRPSFASVIVQILLLDIVFSLDSVITAVGMVDADRDHGRRGRDRGRLHAGLRRADQRLRRAPPDGEDAGAVLPAADRRRADRRGLRSAHPQGLHLLRDGVLARRRDAEPAPAPARRAGPAARAHHDGTRIGRARELAHDRHQLARPATSTRYALE